MCSSDGVPRPAALLERFISADCEACWSDAAARARPRRAGHRLDRAGSRGEDSTAVGGASRDGLARLQALGRRGPAQAQTRAASPCATRKLRVAHGLPFNGYLGTSMELKRGGGGPWKAWLLLVETIPAGAEGTPVERNLVRNAAAARMGRQHVSPKAEQGQLLESRPMSIPEGAKADRLRVVGWVQDARGR